VGVLLPNRPYPPTRRPSDLAEIGLDDLAYRLRMHTAQFFDSRRPEKRSVALVRGSPTVSLNGINFEWSNLESADLQGTFLYRARLIGAQLIGANLTQATLAEADLTIAHLEGANLRDAHLNEATFDSAYLQGASLERANLSGTHFQGARFGRANLTDAKMGFTELGATDLSGVIGLETIQHSGPSTIGIDSLYLSAGNLPETFMRACGVADTVIQYLFPC